MPAPASQERSFFSAGPLMGYIFPLGEHYQGYLNVKGCKEFKAEIGPKAGTLWLSIRHLAGCGRAATRAHADP